MPNTLAHFTVAAPLLARWCGSRELKWLYLGCVIPDIPWILQRVLKLVADDINLYQARAYFVAQSSLFLCVLLCLSLSVATRRPLRVFTILTISCLIHLLLDATQLKWANGVALFAPFDWQIINFGVYWPESAVTYLLSAAGLVILVLSFARASAPADEILVLPGNQQILVSAALLALWLTIPLAYRSHVFESNAHFLATLSDTADRRGQFVEIDRNAVVIQEGQATLKTSFGESLPLSFPAVDRDGLLSGRDSGSDRPPALPMEGSGVYSVKGVFSSPHSLAVIAYHRHGGLRDASSKVGLALVLAVWIVWGYRSWASARCRVGGHGRGLSGRPDNPCGQNRT